jgi:histidinol dehydrogenase
LRRITLSGNLTGDSIRAAIPRADSSGSGVTEVVEKLLAEVKEFGAKALLDHAAAFDGVTPGALRVSPAELIKALAELDPELKVAVEESIARVTKVSEAAMPKAFTVELGPGAAVTQRYVPVDSVGLYVPGGKAVYPSSVVMNAVAAKVAKVPRIVIASPAQKEFGGLPHPSILATAQLLGVDEVYAIGGASAVAAFAFGVEEIGLESVRMVTGPGNIFVATAKKLLRGQIGIDSEAGPTEIMILADHLANPAFIAADLISQAEHDEDAACVLVTPSIELIEAVEAQLALQLPKVINHERAGVALSSFQSAMVLVENMESAILVANEYATEHLEIHTNQNEQILSEISNAGAIFLGEYSPVSLGDYIAGSNHVLPTSEQAKFGPGLGVHTFLRPQQVISYDKRGLSDVSESLGVFARAEGLEAHGRAGEIRFEEGN